MNIGLKFTVQSMIMMYQSTKPNRLFDFGSPRKTYFLTNQC
jgi:hypothetical protein